MKKSPTLIALALLAISTGAHATELQTRLATEIAVQMENGKWNYGPDLNISSLVYIPKDNFDPTRCRIDVGQGRISKAILGTDFNNQPCMTIPGTSRIIISQEVLKEFALANASYKVIGGKKLQARIEAIFKNATVIRGSEGDMAPSDSFLKRINAFLGKMTRVHTLDIQGENSFYLSDGNEVLLRMTITGRETKVIQ